MKLHVIAVLMILTASIIIVPEALAVVRSEGNYDIDVTMIPDPVEDGANATFCVKVSLLDGTDAHDDFRELSIMLGPNTPPPPLAWNPATGCMEGTYQVNRPAGMEPGDSMPFTIYFYPVLVGADQSQPPDGEWGVDESEEDPKQKKWKITYKNPLYFETEGPPLSNSSDNTALGGIIIAVIIIAIAAAIILKRKR